MRSPPRGERKCQLQALADRRVTPFAHADGPGLCRSPALRLIRKEIPILGPRQNTATYLAYDIPAVHLVPCARRQHENFSRLGQHLRVCPSKIYLHRA